MPFIFYYKPTNTDMKFYITEVPKFQTVLSCRTWRLLYKIVKTSKNCQCSARYKIGLTFRSYRGPDEEVTLDEMLKNIDDDNQQHIASDLDPQNCEVIEHEAEYTCMFCDIIPLWFHVHPVLRFLEILHKNIEWVALAENVYYSGWIPIQHETNEKFFVLYEVNISAGALRFIISHIHDQKDMIVRRLQSVCGGANGGKEFKSAAELFKLSCHRTFPRLMHLALVSACQNGCKFNLLPNTLQKRMEELHTWLKLFQPKGQ